VTSVPSVMPPIRTTTAPISSAMYSVFSSIPRVRTMVVGTGTPASIRVQDVFAALPSGRQFRSDIPTPLFWGLVFNHQRQQVTIATRQMVNVPRKHVGIFYGGSRAIYHYSNSPPPGGVLKPPAVFSNSLPRAR